MSIMQRTIMQQPASAVCSNGSSGKTMSKSKLLKKRGKNTSSSSRNKIPLHRRLLRVIGGIALFIAVMNCIYSLRHQGTLPSGMSFTFNFGGSQSKWIFGKAHEEKEPQLELLGDSKHNDHREMLKSRLSQVVNQRKRQEHAEGARQDFNHHNQQQQQQGDGIWPGRKNYNVELRGVQSAQRRSEILARANAVLDGRNDIHAKEAQKGDVRPIRYFMALSKQKGHDKEPILKLIRQNAGIQYISETTYKELPTFADVKGMYGDHPRLVDTDQCAAFRSMGDLGDKYIGVAGTFNSGTNFLAKLLTRNCVLHKRQEKFGIKQRGIRWQVPYGKHTPPQNEEFRNNHVAQKSSGVDASEVLPVVMIRDPFRWLQSMCSHHYTTRWPRVFPRTDPRYHCPNLFPTADEKAKLAALNQEPLVEGEPIVPEIPNNRVKRNLALERLLYIGIRAKDGTLPGGVPDANGNKFYEDPAAEADTDGNDDGETIPEIVEAEPDTSLLSEEERNLHHFPVSIKYSNFTRFYRSLAHHWNEWYQEYLDLPDYPHVIVRMEDLLFFPDQVVPQICACAGGRLLRGDNATVQVVAQSAKSKHSTKYMEEGEEHTGYLDALIKYGHSATRFKGMTPHDLQYAQQYLNRDMMELFGYGYPDESLMTTASEEKDNEESGESNGDPEENNAESGENNAEAGEEEKDE
ncbi:expressed unknown protein [Seminavis robusta]|uniref:Uncharacterized protein n=1 Tax=Seminavis robusta TaxID=568900 RepID=A0A9N8ETV1_9STRA|nr:expressed unknown protein [Seminavis robusta]|eukprot:Sro1676_g290450.1 n/a (689) ;mRNA; r:3448-5514